MKKRLMIAVLVSVTGCAPTVKPATIEDVVVVARHHNQLASTVMEMDKRLKALEDSKGGKK